MECSEEILTPPGGSAAHKVIKCSHKGSGCIWDHGNDTRHTELLPTISTGPVLASATKSTCTMSWNKIMSWAGFIPSQYHLGIRVPDPPVLPVVETQSRETADLALRHSKLHAMQKYLQPLQICASRKGKKLCLSSFT